MWTRDPESEVLPACAKLGIGFVPFSPLGKRFLPGTVDRGNQFADGDVCGTIPRFREQNRSTYQVLVDHVRALARARGATPG